MNRSVNRRALRARVSPLLTMDNVNDSIMFVQDCIVELRSAGELGPANQYGILVVSALVYALIYLT